MNVNSNIQTDFSTVGKKVGEVVINGSGGADAPTPPQVAQSLQNDYLTLSKEATELGSGGADAPNPPK